MLHTGAVKRLLPPFLVCRSSELESLPFRDRRRPPLTRKSSFPSGQAAGGATKTGGKVGKRFGGRGPSDDGRPAVTRPPGAKPRRLGAERGRGSLGEHRPPRRRPSRPRAAPLPGSPPSRPSLFQGPGPLLSLDVGPGRTGRREDMPAGLAPQARTGQGGRRGPRSRPGVPIPRSPLTSSAPACSSGVLCVSSPRKRRWCAGSRAARGPTSARRGAWPSRTSPAPSCVPSLPEGRGFPGTPGRLSRPFGFLTFRSPFRFGAWESLDYLFSSLWKVGWFALYFGWFCSNSFYQVLLDSLHRVPRLGKGQRKAHLPGARICACTTRRKATLVLHFLILVDSLGMCYLLGHTSKLVFTYSFKKPTQQQLQF